MQQSTQRLTDEQRAQFQELGYVRIPGFADAATCERMLERIVEIAHAHADSTKPAAPGFVLPEANLSGRTGAPEELVSKIFKLHREDVFAEFAASTAVTDLLVDLIGPDQICFLSQFIFKNPGAWGQPWHQDSFYFRLEPRRPIVGVWLAVTEATLENGCLHVLPSSHTEPIHEHVPDRRPNANYGYVEIVDHDMGPSQPVLMDPGDLLLFDSHLMHRSTDNESPSRRAAMVYHYAPVGAVDKANSPVNDLVIVR